MKVLWITNVLFPDICSKLGVKQPVVGGWMKSSAQAILQFEDGIEMAVATLYGDKYRKDVINHVTYYCLPFNIYDKNVYNSVLEQYWRRVAGDFHPDVVHIHGTEFPHGLAYMKANSTDNVVVSIQGLVGGYARYSLGSIPERILKRYRTIYDCFRGHLLRLPLQMARAGELENKYFELSHHVIGRTSWDKDHLWAVNPNACYHFCNETLRDPFYSTTWELNKCNRHTIFLSQAHKPIKGIHKVIEALPFIIRHYPDVKVYVAGNDFTQRCTWQERLKFGTFANYVVQLMDRLGVRERFYFTGMLDECQMAEQYRMAHIFVCPSSIENSPNSLGEAQLVGTPVVASYVGGVPDMVKNEMSGLLYRFEEVEMLATAVCRIFGDDDLATHLSTNGKVVARQRHDRQKNALRTLEIYNKVISKNNGIGNCSE